MKTTYSTPQWAIELTEQVCKDYTRSLPKELQWFKRNTGGGYERVELGEGRYSYKKVPRKYSSGWTRSIGNKIHIAAGTDESDQKLVLLHELAHHILNKTKKGRHQGHTLKFWRLAFQLYIKYEVGLEKGYEREKHYRGKATWAYNELKAQA